MKHFITLFALSLAPLSSFAADAHDHDAEKKAPAPATAKSAAHVHKAGDGCCEDEGHSHGDDITLSPALVTKFGIATEKLGPGKIARTTLLTGTLAKDESLAKSPALVVEAKISERAAAKLKAGESRLRVAPPGGQSDIATFHSVVPVSGASKGVTTVRFIMENKGGVIEAGSRAEFRLVTSEKEFALTVPRDAIQGAKGKTFVYVEEKPGVYERHPVVVTDSDELRAAITGPDAGEAIVTKGAAVNSALDAAHGHKHGPNGEEPGHDHAAHDHADHAGHTHAKPAPSPAK
jgi:hypothetical protein